MRLTLHTDYALRLMMLLAMEPDHRHTIEEVARRYGISRNHLMKVAQTLVQAGFIGALRGRGGGLRLELPAGAINLGAVPGPGESSKSRAGERPDGGGCPDQAHLRSGEPGG